MKNMKSLFGKGITTIFKYIMDWPYQSLAKQKKRKLK